MKHFNVQASADDENRKRRRKRTATRRISSAGRSASSASPSGCASAQLITNINRFSFAALAIGMIMLVLAVDLTEAFHFRSTHAAFVNSNRLGQSAPTRGTTQPVQCARTSNLFSCRSSAASVLSSSSASSPTALFSTSTTMPSSLVTDEKLQLPIPEEEVEEDDVVIDTMQLTAIHQKLGRSMKHQEKLDWLQKRLKLSDNQIEKMIRQSPKLTTCSIEDNMEPTLQWLQLRLDLTDKQLSKLIITHPQLLGYCIHKNLQPKLEFLQAELGLDNPQLAKLIRKYPTMLGLNLERNIRMTFSYLRQRLDLDDEQQLRRIVLKFPLVLGLRIPDNLEPKILWLEHLGRNRRHEDDSAHDDSTPSLSPSSSTTATLSGVENIEPTTKAVKKMILISPNLLGFSIDGNLQPTVDYLTSRMNLTPNQLSSIVTKFPSLLKYNIMNNTEPTLDWFNSTFQLETPEALGAFVQRMPPLLGLSVANNLQPTLKFYEECLGRNHAKAINLIMNNPFFLGMSLDGRLRPRLQQVIEARNETGMVITPLSTTQTYKLAKLTPQAWNATMVSGTFFWK